MRDGSGNYSLPAGNPISYLTRPISSSTFNATMTDIATEIEDSLSRSGKGGMLADLSLGGYSLTSVLNATLTGALSAATITASGNVTLSGLTATTVPYLSAGKVLTSSAVTPTELGYLSGVTSAIQTQLNAKVGSSALSDYLTTATAASTYQTQAGMSSYLTTATASSTYQTQAGMSSYMPKSGGAFSGGITGTTAGFSGALTAASLQATSSREMKQNIRPVSPGALDRVLAWSVSEYEFIADPGQVEVGLIAEDEDGRISTGKAIKTNVALFELAAAVQELARKAG